MNLKSVIESILFVADRPLKLLELEKITGQPKEKILEAIAALTSERASSGMVLLEQNQQYLLATRSENADFIKAFLNLELREKLTDAALETLAIVVYKQPVSRAEIEAIRGVNSQYTLRLLQMRGLLEKTKSAADARVQLYRTTHEFLQHMGIRSLHDLPDFEELTQKVKPPQGFETNA